MRKEKLLSEIKNDLKINYKNVKVYQEFGVENWDYPLVLAVPHAGRFFPPEFLARSALDQQQLRSNEDLFVDEIVMPLSGQGIPLLSMNFARAFIDANREKIELDSKMFYDYPVDNIAVDNHRCRFGLGLIHRIDADNNAIYKGLLSFDEVQERIKNVYDVYHKRLQQLVGKCVKKFGFCVLLDCHSMPSKICSIIPDSPQIDFCLGDLYSQSCPPEMTDFLHQEFNQKGYNVSVNVPYSGAFTTFNYCQPRKKIYTLQLEINREIYADEKSLQKNTQFQQISNDTVQAVLNFAKFLLDF